MIVVKNYKVTLWKLDLVTHTRSLKNNILKPKFKRLDKLLQQKSIINTTSTLNNKQEYNLKVMMKWFMKIKLLNKLLKKLNDWVRSLVHSLIHFTRFTRSIHQFHSRYYGLPHIHSFISFIHEHATATAGAYNGLN